MKSSDFVIRVEEQSLVNFRFRKRVFHYDYVKIISLNNDGTDFEWIPIASGYFELRELAFSSYCKAVGPQSPNTALSIYSDE